MADFLDKEEIEALLSAVSQGRIPKKAKKREPSYQETATSYNFKRPALVSKEQIRVLEFLHEDFLRNCEVKLSNYLRTTVELEIIAIEQLTYVEFIASLAEPTYIGVLDAEPLSGQIILEINPLLIFSIVDRLLGGSGRGTQEPRELTSIEHFIMDKVVTLVMEALKEAWKHVVSLHLTFKTKESNPQFVQVVSGGELVIPIIFKVNMRESFGIMNICYPVSTLKPVLPRLNPQRWISEKKEKIGNETLRLLQKKLSNTQVEVIVELGRSNITILDFLNLAPGDVIRLNQPIDQDLIIKIQGSPKFYALPGTVGRRKAVKVTSYIKKEDEDGE